MRKGLLIVYGKIYLFYKISTLFLYDGVLNLCWYCWGGGSFLFRLLCCRVLSEKNWRPASGHEQYQSSARDLICYFTNKWLPSIPISSIFNIYISERGTFSVFFLPTSYSCNVWDFSEGGNYFGKGNTKTQWVNFF